MNDQLKLDACKFCGVHVLMEFVDKWDGWTFRCGGCGMLFIAPHAHRTEADAIAAWNRRPEPKPQEVVPCDKDSYIPLSTVVDSLHRNIQIRATLGPDDSRRRGVNTAILMWLVCHWDELYARLCAEPEPKPDTSREIAVLEKMVEEMIDDTQDECPYAFTPEQNDPKCQWIHDETGANCAVDRGQSLRECWHRIYRARAEKAITEQGIPEPKPLTCGECACGTDWGNCDVFHKTIGGCGCVVDLMMQKRDRMNAERGEDAK